MTSKGFPPTRPLYLQVSEEAETERFGGGKPENLTVVALTQVGDLSWASQL